MKIYKIANKDLEKEAVATNNLRPVVFQVSFPRNNPDFENADGRWDDKMILIIGSAFSDARFSLSEKDSIAFHKSNVVMVGLDTLKSVLGKISSHFPVKISDRGDVVLINIARDAGTMAKALGMTSGL